MVKLNIELVGNEDDVLSFVGLCAKLELLGIWGASRTIPVAIDGDGSARLKFNIESEVKDQGKIDLIEAWWKAEKEGFKNEVENDSIKTHYIGY